MRTAAEQGFDAISPIHGSPFPPASTMRRTSPSRPRRWSTTPHDAGLRVIPYVVDDPPTMRPLIRLGVDGLITNYPDRLREVLVAAGRTCRRPFPGRRHHRRRPVPSLRCPSG